MRIIMNSKAQDSNIHNSNKKQNFLDNRIGFWGNVVAVNSQMNSADVIADIGITYRNIPVMSSEWVNASDDKDYVTAERNLPPVGARVFVLTPSHTITGAFVLCSGFAKGDSDTHILYASSDDEQEEKNAIRERVSQGGWNETEDYANGNRAYKSVDESIVLTVNVEENSDKEQEKEISLVAWKNEIHVTEEGITIYIPEDANLTVNIEGDNSLTIKGNHTISVEGDYSESVKGNYGGTVDGDYTKAVKGKCEITSDGDLKFASGQSGKVEVGNTVATLGAMVTDLLGYLAQLKTMGSPASHTAAPDFIANIQALKAKWGQVFK